MNTETLFDDPYLICSEADQGDKTKGICILSGIEVDGEFTIGPVTLRQLNTETDKFPDHIRKDPQHSVLEIRYIDGKESLHMYGDPMFVQRASLKAFQLMVNSWTGSSLMYHFRESGEQVGGASGSACWETADTEFVREGAMLLVTDDNKELFKRIFYACFGDLKHSIDRFSRACSEIKDESILDFVISLEGTLGYRLHSEITHRLSSRGAFLLSETEVERELYYQLIKTLYNLRSTIAHGSEITASIVKKEKFVAAITTLGYWPGDWNNESDMFKVRHTADIARQVARKILLEFIENTELLNEDNLLKLELGLN